LSSIKLSSARITHPDSIYGVVDSRDVIGFRARSLRVAVVGVVIVLIFFLFAAAFVFLVFFSVRLLAKEEIGRQPRTRWGWIQWYALYPRLAVASTGYFFGVEIKPTWLADFTGFMR
jgi:hypothetical protein